MTKKPFPKVFLLGGTSETAPLSMKIASVGYRVLVSTATDEPLPIGEHPGIGCRFGRLGLAEMKGLLVAEGVSALVDATHPYASEVHQTARHACNETGLPYLRFQRPDSQVQEVGWLFADNHQEAALLACDTGRPILLTTGSRNLRPYVQEASRNQIPLYARILKHDESINASNDAGLEESQRIIGRGPFTYEDNVALIRRYRIGVVVSKESGRAGGIDEKWRAARDEGCTFVVVKRPLVEQGNSFGCMDDLVRELLQLI